MGYIDFFEFKDHPFRITPDVDFYFTSETHSESFESLKYFIDSDEGFLTLVGEPGTGKTITLRKFLNELPDDVECAYILFPSLQPEDMFRAVLEDFGYRIKEGISKNTLFSGFRDFLTKKKEQGKRILLVIDEAQNLPTETLEELRILSNLETEKEKLIQFVLAGQPELKAKLNSDNLRQLKQRISLHTELKLLNPDEIEKYIIFRLSKAGFSGKYPEDKFYKRLQEITGGNPRLINLTMERALMSAYLRQSKFMNISDLEVANASLDMASESVSVKHVNGLTYILLGIIALLCMVIAYQYINPMPIKIKPTKQMEQTIQKEVSTSASKPKPVKTEKPKTEIKKEPAAKPKAEIKTKITEKKIPEKKVKAVTKKTAKKPPSKKASLKTGYVTIPTLNMRLNPTTNKDNIMMKLSKGTKVTIRRSLNDWLLVKVHGRSGWVHKDYIRVN